MAAQFDARVFDPTDLRKMLRYGVGSEARAALCTRHLDPSRRTLASRLAARLRDLPRVANSRVLAIVRSSPPGWLRVFVAAAVVLSGVAVATVVIAPGIDSDADGAATAAVTPVSLSTVSTQPAPQRQLAPGVTRAGIANLTALAGAHERAIAPLSYTLSIDIYRPRNGDPGAPVVERSVDATVTDRRYLLRTTVKTSAVKDGDASTIQESVQTVYHDGDGWYVADFRGSKARYRQHTDVQSPLTVVPGPDVLERTLVTWYLATPATAVAGRAVEDGRDHLRLVGEGPPTGLGFDVVRDYRVTATVDRRGVVHSLTARYRVVTSNGTYPVVFEVTYEEFGRTTVEPPRWYEREFDRNPEPAPNLSPHGAERTTAGTARSAE